MRGRGYNGLRRTVFVLHKYVDDVTEMTVQHLAAHGRAQFQCALEGDYFDFKSLFGKEAFICSHMQDDGIGCGQSSDSQGAEYGTGSSQSEK